MSSSSERRPVLNYEDLPKRVKEAEYAVRGELVLKAEKIAAHLRETHNYPFSEIVYCNIGNPQALAQKPITFFRQVLSLVEYPELISNPASKQIFPKDAISRASDIISHIHSVGAYSHSQGIPLVRKHVAEFISKRDGFACDPENIFLYNGASPGVQNCLKLTLRQDNDGIMIPIPQYPLYSASIKLLGGTQVGYYLDEENGWGLSVQELQNAYKKAKDSGIHPRAIAIINPGNPTGQVLPEKNIKEIIEFAHNHNLLIMADEVYQENVYDPNKKFHSFKKVLSSMEGHIKQQQELVSFHSVSKGFVGECGQRGGYLECINIQPKVKAELYKLSSIDLCPNVAGQLLIDLMVKPPQHGEESYELYSKEKDAIMGSLKRRADKLTTFLNTLPGVKCNPAEGAMYAFAQIALPQKAIHEAEKAGKKPDTFYALDLLEKTGLCVVPGSGFGQKDGTFHFRTTFLPSEEKLNSVMEKLATFQKEFMAKYK